VSNPLLSLNQIRTPPEQAALDEVISHAKQAGEDQRGGDEGNVQGKFENVTRDFLPFDPRVAVWSDAHVHCHSIPVFNFYLHCY
jgi:hypothetical protein